MELNDVLKRCGVVEKVDPEVVDHLNDGPSLAGCVTKNKEFSTCVVLFYFDLLCSMSVEELDDIVPGVVRFFISN